MSESLESSGSDQIKRLVERPWLLFLGAGASAQCGVKPWKALADAAIQLGRQSGAPAETLQYAENLLSRERLALVFDAIEQELPPGAWTNWLKQETTEVRGFGELHTSLFRLRPSGVITTNYDRIAEGAYGQVLGRGPAVFDNDTSGLLSVQAAGQFVCHFHGTVDGRGILVLGAQSYRQFYGGSTGPRDCIRQLLLRYNVLYVGFGHGDLDFEHLCQGALDQLHPDYYAVSLQPSEQLSHTFTERLRRLNIQTLAYDRIDSQHTGLLRLLESVQSTPPSRRSGALRLGRDGGEPLPIKSAIVGILCLEGGAHGQMRELLPASALLAAILDSTVPRSMTDLHTALVNEYSLPSSVSVDKVRQLAQQLESEGIVASSNDIVTVDAPTRERYMGLVTQKRADLRTLVIHIAAIAVEEGARGVERSNLEGNIEGFLAELFKRHGIDVADSVLANRPVVQDLADAVSRSVENVAPNNRRAQVAIQRAVLRVFRDPSAHDAKAIYWLCQTYFLIGAYALDPEGAVLSQSLFAGVRLWLDSNVILPLLADYHPLQVSYSRLLEGSVSQGSHLLVLTDVLDEVYGNSARAWQIASEFDHDPAAIEVYVESLGWERANVYLVGFIRALHAGRIQTWQEYAGSSGIPEPSDKAFKPAIRALVERKVGASILRPSLDPTEIAAVSPLTDEIEAQRKAAWQFRYRVLCKNEALQILQVYHDRKLAPRPDATPAAWFISTDGFVNRLFEYHAGEWLLPCAQHPIRWFQALEAVNAAAAAYKGFSGLFMNVALTAYREDDVRKLLASIHTRYRDLMAKRPEEVKALFVKVLREFATRQDSDVTQGALSPKELAEHEDEAIRVALSRFNEEATKLFGEHDMLKVQLAEARTAVRTLEEQLQRRGTKELKKGYKQRRLQEQVRLQERRISELQRALREVRKRT